MQYGILKITYHSFYMQEIQISIISFLLIFKLCFKSQNNIYRISGFY